MTSDTLVRLKHALKLHRWVFFAVNLVAFGLGLWLSNSSLVAWFLLVTGAALLVHVVAVRAMEADDDWADDRAQRLLRRNYERGNIDGVLIDERRRREQMRQSANTTPADAERERQ